MIRFGLVLAGALLCLPTGGADARRPVRAPALPLPPLPPRPVISGALPIPPLPPYLQLAPAPVPNADARPPAPSRPGGASAEPALFNLPGSFRGDGYPYGASPQGVDDQRTVRVPGMRLTLPLP